VKPRILDLFCGAGGAAMGYYRAGFDVVGVDIEPQKNYPFEFILADALQLMDALTITGEWRGNSSNGFTVWRLKDLDAFHASPPCQKYSVMTNGRWQDRVAAHPDLIKPTRERLVATGKPYIIENVPGAKAELINPIMLCGTMFGLQTKGGSQLRRHRYFETSWFWEGFLPQCQHNKGSAIGVYGGGATPEQAQTGYDWSLGTRWRLQQA